MTPLKVDIARLLQRLGIDAKRKSKEWAAKCPNPKHDDHDPSWRIRDDPGATRHGFHHCWPCGFGGTAIDLVMALKGCEYRDARKWLEDSGAIIEQDVSNAEIEIKVARTRLRFQLPPGVVCAELSKWPTLARRYWTDTRKLEPWQVDRWGIGYAIEGRLKGRIVIVYRDVFGRPVRYTARTFVDEGRRYLEPEPHEKANPSAMFGEQHWPDLEERKNSTLFVVEGAINGLALEAELPGIYFGATAGSEERPLYAVKLSGWKRVCFMSDPDAAGDRVAETLETSLARTTTETGRIRLPSGIDCAKLRELRPGELGSIVRSWLDGG